MTFLMNGPLSDSVHVLVFPPDNQASRWTGDFWSKSVLIIMAHLRMFFYCEIC